MGIFDRNTKDTTDRFDAFQKLVAAAEALVQQAAQVLEADTQAARQYNRDVVGPWRERAAQAEENLKRTALLHAAEIRACRELIERGEPALAVEAHGQLLRDLRTAWQQIEAVREDAPQGHIGISQETVGWFSSRAPRPISPTAQRVLRELLPFRPSTAGTSAADDARSRLADYVRHDLQELRIAGAFLWAHGAIAPLLDRQEVAV